MLNPRLPVARPLALCLWLGSIAAVGVWGCQGPDTFLRIPASVTGTGGVRNGVGGSTFGIGGHGIGGTIGTGGAATGTGGQTGTGGAAAGGMTGSGGITGTGGARDGGVDAPGPDGPTGTGGMIVVVDANQDVEGGGTGPCAGICAPTTVVTTFTVTTGQGFHSPTLIGLGEACYASTPDSRVQGVVCSNFMANGGNRMLSINGVADPTCTFSNPPPPTINGGYCFQISPGVPEFAALAVY